MCKGSHVRVGSHREAPRARQRSALRFETTSAEHENARGSRNSQQLLMTVSSHRDSPYKDRPISDGEWRRGFVQRIVGEKEQSVEGIRFGNGLQKKGSARNCLKSLTIS